MTTNPSNDTITYEIKEPTNTLTSPATNPSSANMQEIKITKSSELYEYALLNLLKLPAFMEETNNMKFHEKSDKYAVIIDPRFDDLIEAVIRNFMYFMNPKGWNLMIISYSGYADRIKSKFPNSTFLPIDDALIQKDANGNPNITIGVYNAIMLNIDFWKRMPPKVAIFQKDCVMYKMFDDYYAEVYDYAGAIYDGSLVKTPDIEEPIISDNKSIFHGGINGGFSLRKSATMIECLEKITFEKITHYRQTLIDELNITYPETFEGKLYHFKAQMLSNAEDVFYTHACEMLRKSMPDPYNRTRLAVECYIIEDTCVYHGWNKNYQPLNVAIDLLMKSPLFSTQFNKEPMPAPAPEIDPAIAIATKD